MTDRGPTVPTPVPRARPAGVDDVPELVRLRGVMFAGLAPAPGDGTVDDDWRGPCARALTAALRSGGAAAFVVPAPDGAGLASGAVGLVDQRLPGPGRDGRSGHVGSVATDPRWRRRGFARAAVTGLLAWFDAAGIDQVQLGAAAAGEPLYRSLGFAPYDTPRLVRRRPG